MRRTSPHCRSGSTKGWLGVQSEHPKNDCDRTRERTVVQPHQSKNRVRRPIQGRSRSRCAPSPKKANGNPLDSSTSFRDGLLSASLSGCMLLRGCTHQPSGRRVVERPKRACSGARPSLLLPADGQSRPTTSCSVWRSRVRSPVRCNSPGSFRPPPAACPIRPAAR